MPKISIIIPIYNEEKYIKECILSIMQCDYDIAQMEILLVDGMSEDGTREIIRQLQQRYTCIALIDNPQKIAPVAMNLGIKEAKGEYLFIVSAHASYTKSYFTKLVEQIQRLDADCVGGVLKTDVKNHSVKADAIKEVLSHPLGVGNASFRTGSTQIREVDTVAFGCYNKKTFELYGYFDETLVRNQDIELNKRIVNGGGKIYLIPDVQCTYYARENFRDLAKNQYQNGFWNMLTAYYTKTLNSLSLRHFIPLLFVLSLIIPFGISFIFPQMLWLSLFSLVSYLSLVIIISIKLKNSSNSIVYLIMSFLILHFSYGLGSLMGLFAVAKKTIKGEK